MATLQDAANAALRNGAKKMKVANHEFNVKRATYGWQGDGKYRISGRLSHCLAFRPDDQFDYSVTIGLYPPSMDSSSTVQLGGFASILAPVFGAALAGLAPPLLSVALESFNTEVLKNVIHGLEEEVAGKGWRHVAQGIVATLCVLQMQEIQRTAPPPPPGYVPPHPVPDKPQRPIPTGGATP